MIYDIASGAVLKREVGTVGALENTTPGVQIRDRGRDFLRDGDDDSNDDDDSDDDDSDDDDSDDDNDDDDDDDETMTTMTTTAAAVAAGIRAARQQRRRLRNRWPNSAKRRKLPAAGAGAPDRLTVRGGRLKGCDR